MRRFIIAISLVCFSFCSFAAVSTADLYRVWGRLPHGNIPISIDESNIVNAYAHYENGRYWIVITSGMLDYIKNKDELAVILAHELGHVAQGRSLGTEQGADNYGNVLARAKGYNMCSARYIYKRFYIDFGTGDGDGDHPANKSRFERLSTGCPYEDVRRW